MAPMRERTLSTLSGLALALAAQAAAQPAVPIRWATVGNSITQGSGYPAKLQTLLGPAYQVENEGVSATTMLKKSNFSYWTNGRLPQTFAFKPDIVSIKLGTNDSKPVNWPSHKNEFLGDTRALIDTLAAMPSKPRILPCYPVPVFQKNGAWAVDGINEPVVKNEIMPFIKQAATEKNLTLVDLHTFLENRGDLFAGDGVHPDNGKAGADSIAAMLYRTYLANVTRIACIGDSVAAGAAAATAYPVRFHQLLGRDHYVLNAGAPGAGVLKAGPKAFAKSEQLKAVFRFQPNVVLVQLGAWDSPAPVWDANKEGFSADLGALIDTLGTLPGKPRIVLCTPIPAWKKSDGSEAFGIRGAVLQDEIVPRIKQVAQAKGVAVLDLWTAYQPYQRLNPDGVVPNAEGQDTLAHLLFRAYKAAPVSLVRPASGRAGRSAGPEWRPFQARGRDALGRRPRNPAESGLPAREGASGAARPESGL